MPPKCTYRAKIGYCTVNVAIWIGNFLDLLQKIVLLDFKRNQNMKKPLLHTSALFGRIFCPQNFKQDSLQFKENFRRNFGQW